MMSVADFWTGVDQRSWPTSNYDVLQHALSREEIERVYDCKK